MTADRWPDADELRQQLQAQLALEARFPGWQVLHTMRDRWVRYVYIPQGSFFAVHDRLSEPPLFALELEVLSGLVVKRQDQLEQAEQWSTRSDLRYIVRAHRRMP